MGSSEKRDDGAAVATSPCAGVAPGVNARRTSAAREAIASSPRSVAALTNTVCPRNTDAHRNAARCERVARFLQSTSDRRAVRGSADGDEVQSAIRILQGHVNASSLPDRKRCAAHRARRMEKCAFDLACEARAGRAAIAFRQTAARRERRAGHGRRRVSRARRVRGYNGELTASAPIRNGYMFV